MENTNLSKIGKHKVHWLVSTVILLGIFLMASYEVGVRASGSQIFAGSVSAQITISTCTNQYTCSACSFCGCGQWDQDTIAARFGTTAGQSFYACKTPAYTPMGTGSLNMGSIVLGYCPSTELSTYSTSCNLWTQ